MTRLSRLQEDFQAYPLRYEQRIRNQVIGTSRACADERLSIYATAYRLRLLEALGTDFPKLHTLVGDAEFDRLGRAYIDAHPSEDPSLRWFGKHLSGFLRVAYPYNVQPVLAEMAAFEWAQGEVFDAKDSSNVSVEKVAAIAPESWPKMRLRLHPSVRRLELEWNVTALWRAIDNKNLPPAPERVARATTWLLWRSRFEVNWRPLEAIEVWAINACLQGKSFGTVCEGLCEWIEESGAAHCAAGMLKRWVLDGIVSHVETFTRHQGA